MFTSDRSESPVSRPLFIRVHPWFKASENLLTDSAARRAQKARWIGGPDLHEFLATVHDRGQSHRATRSPSQIRKVR